MCAGAVAFAFASSGLAAEAKPSTQPPEKSELVALAAAKFPDLTRAERALLEFAQVGNVERNGQFAVAGTSANPDDPSNNPAHANEWSKDREIRAQLIRWLCEEPEAMRLLWPGGINVLGARIVGDMMLDAVQPPCGLTLVKCAIPGRISLAGAHLRWLILSGSYTGPINAPSLTSDLAVLLDGVHSSGPLYMDSAKVDGPLNASGAHFRHGPGLPPGIEAGFAGWKLAVRINYASIRGFIDLTNGFEADGGVEIDNSSIGGDFTLFGSHFINPNSVAFEAASDVIGGEVMLSFTVGAPVPAEFSGSVQLFDDQIAGGFYASRVIFAGPPQSSHGLSIITTPIKGGLFLDAMELRNGARLDLTGSSAHLLIDRDGWPAPGKLFIDGFTYDLLGPPNLADERLRWLALQYGFHPQPYRQLAKYLAESGDDSGAVKVLIAKEDLYYSELGFTGRLLGRVLKYTIGYGHRPLLAIAWSLAVVLCGWAVVWIARAASVMRPTYPENPPPSKELCYQALHPLLYSLDVFVPFVNLHQEHYWWPDGGAAGDWVFLRRRFTVRGSTVEYYLWAQIIAGWLLSAIFVAGVTGLIRGD